MKTFILRLLKFSGFFHVARWLTRRSARILCYHGVSVDDQYEFENVLFMKAETFLRRMMLLQKWRFPVLPLREITEALADGKELPNCATAITIDDGWYTTFSEQIPVLLSLRFPATVYLTTYYVEKQTDVFNVLVRYAFWRTVAISIDSNALRPWFDISFDLSQAETKTRALETILAEGEKLRSVDRQDLAAAIATALGLDFQKIQSSRMFKMMSPEDVRAMVEAGIDVQLHTHRHNPVPPDEQTLLKEIEENRASLLKMGAKAPFDQFCYPTGVFTPAQAQWLNRAGVKNATTCTAGLNPPGTPPYFLHRFLDKNRLSDLEYEAELCGVLQILRAFRKIW